MNFINLYKINFILYGFQLYKKVYINNFGITFD